MEGTGVSLALGKGRKNNHSYGAVGQRRFIPGNEDGSALAVSLGTQDRRQVAGQPPVSLGNFVPHGPAAVMHVVTDVGGDEVVLRNVTSPQVPGQLLERTDMSNAVARVRISVAGDVIEIDKGIVPDSVGVAVGQRTTPPGYSFLVGLPGDPLPVQQRDQVLAGGLATDAGRVVIQNAEIRARLQPKIIG